MRIPVDETKTVLKPEFGFPENAIYCLSVGQKPPFQSNSIYFKCQWRRMVGVIKSSGWLGLANRCFFSFEHANTVSYFWMGFYSMEPGIVTSPRSGRDFPCRGMCLHSLRFWLRNTHDSFGTSPSHPAPIHSINDILCFIPHPVGLSPLFRYILAKIGHILFIVIPRCYQNQQGGNKTEKHHWIQRLFFAFWDPIFQRFFFNLRFWWLSAFIEGK